MVMVSGILVVVVVAVLVMVRLVSLGVSLRV